MRKNEVYMQCDRLEDIPAPNRENWLAEMKLLIGILPKNSRVLQIGSMDGTRMIALLNARPDLILTGLEIEPALVDLCRKKLVEAGKAATCVLGDITNPSAIGTFDFVICLNNTLGYITDQKAALAGMRSLGKRVIISVYGERFNDQVAQEYFASLGLTIEAVESNTFTLHNFGQVRRYTRSEVESWNGDITETPIGYFVELEGLNAL